MLCFTVSLSGQFVLPSLEQSLVKILSCLHDHLYLLRLQVSQLTDLGQFMSFECLKDGFIGRFELFDLLLIALANFPLLLVKLGVVTRFGTPR